MGEVGVPFSRLSQDADEIIRMACTYTKCEIIWDPVSKSHAAVFERVELGCQDHVPLDVIAGYIEQSREIIQQRMVDHILSEVKQDGYGAHGSRSSYAMGCRGLLCRRAHREGMRIQQGTKRSPKYAAADDLLKEVEERFERNGASLAPFLAGASA